MYIYIFIYLFISTYVLVVECDVAFIDAEGFTETCICVLQPERTLSLRRSGSYKRPFGAGYSCTEEEKSARAVAKSGRVQKTRKLETIPNSPLEKLLLQLLTCQSLERFSRLHNIPKCIHYESSGVKA
jgi:hypothetical protein